MFKYLIFLLFLLHYTYGITNLEILATITTEDKKTLDKFFHTLFAHDHFGYSLFGKKPLSLSGEFLITPWENTMCNFPPSGLFWKGWQTWEKYASNLRFKNFLLIREEGRLPNAPNVILINKKAFVKKINDHKEIFEKVLKKTIDAEDILKQIEEGKKSFKESIDDKEVLWGILLGYGVQNSSLFALNRVPLKEGYLKFAGECKQSPFWRIYGVAFLADPNDSETKVLEKQYNQERERLLAIYSKGDFFLQSFNKLCSND